MAKRRVSKAVKEALYDIYRKHGYLSADLAVKEAQKYPPLYNTFEWDEAVAAHEYRLQQACLLIRCVITVLPNSEKEYRAFVSLEPDRGEKSYRALVDVLSDDDMRHQLLQQAFREFKSFKAKYQDLAELKEAFEAMTAAEKKAVVKEMK